jgi:hypothetical protein
LSKNGINRHNQIQYTTLQFNTNTIDSNIFRFIQNQKSGQKEKSGTGSTLTQKKFTKWQWLGQSFASPTTQIWFT